MFVYVFRVFDFDAPLDHIIKAQSVEGKLDH